MRNFKLDGKNNSEEAKSAEKIAKIRLEAQEMIVQAEEKAKAAQAKCRKLIWTLWACAAVTCASLGVNFYEKFCKPDMALDMASVVYNNAAYNKEMFLSLWEANHGNTFLSGAFWNTRPWMCHNPKASRLWHLESVPDDETWNSLSKAQQAEYLFYLQKFLGAAHPEEPEALSPQRIVYDSYGEIANKIGLDVSYMPDEDTWNKLSDKEKIEFITQLQACEPELKEKGVRALSSSDVSLDDKYPYQTAMSNIQADMSYWQEKVFSMLKSNLGEKELAEAIWEYQTDGRLFDQIKRWHNGWGRADRYEDLAYAFLRKHGGTSPAYPMDPEIRLEWQEKKWPMATMGKYPIEPKPGCDSFEAFPMMPDFIQRIQHQEELKEKEKSLKSLATHMVNDKELDRFVAVCPWVCHIPKESPLWNLIPSEKTWENLDDLQQKEFMFYCIKLRRSFESANRAQAMTDIALDIAERKHQMLEALQDADELKAASHLWHIQTDAKLLDLFERKDVDSKRKMYYIFKNWRYRNRNLETYNDVYTYEMNPTKRNNWPDWPRGGIDSTGIVPSVVSEELLKFSTDYEKFSDFCKRHPSINGMDK